MSLVVLVFVASNELHTPATDAMVASTRAAIGGGVVLVQEGAPPDSEALGTGEALHADTVVEVTWTADHRIAHLHAHARGQPKWIDRDLSFAAVDDPGERGRAVGLAIAAIVPPEQPPPPPSTSPSATTSLHASVDAAIQGALGSSEAAGGLGGLVAFRLGIGDYWTLRAHIGARFGDIDDGDKDYPLSIVHGGLGASVEAIHEGRFALAVQMDGMIVRQSVARPRVEGGYEQHARWVPAADLLLDGSWSLGPRMSLFSAIGGEISFGETRVVVGNEELDSLSRFRGIMLLGVRLRF